MAICPQHTFQVLTKRAARMHAYLTDPSFGIRVGGELMKAARGNAGVECVVLGITHRLTVQSKPLPNVWLGASIEDQRRCDERLWLLAGTKAAIRFVSYEPALERVDFGRELSSIDWLIYGDESGPNARLADEAWARSARDQCAATGTAFFLKQRRIGREMISLPALDGVIHDARPVLRDERRAA